jgi:hypothetical protein
MSVATDTVTVAGGTRSTLSLGGAEARHLSVLDSEYNVFLLSLPVHPHSNFSMILCERDGML